MNLAYEPTYTDFLNARHERDMDYLVRRISPQESYDALLKFPRYFEIETVNACNATCPMCTIADWKREAGLMKDDLFKKIAYEIGAHPEVKRVHLYRDGEPLLDKRLHRKIKLLKSLNVRRVGISTNCSLLDREHAEAILWAGIDEVILSVDSIRSDTYEKIRTGLDFGDVMNNAQEFFRLRDDVNPECQIWVRMIRQELNDKEWPEYRSYWAGYANSSDRIDYRYIHNWGTQLKDFKAISTADTHKPCVALWSLMTIFADGSVPLCNVDYNNKYPLGSVLTNTISEIWQSQEQARRQQMHLDRERNKIPPCEHCTVWSEK